MKPYGCHNKDHQDGYWVKDCVIVKGGIGIQLMKYIKDTSSRECRYDRKAKDARCEGCVK